MDTEVLAVVLGGATVYLLLLFFQFMEPLLHLCERYEKSRRLRIINGIIGTAALAPSSSSGISPGKTQQQLS